MKFRSFNELLSVNAERNGRSKAFVFDVGGEIKSAAYEELYRDARTASCT